MAAKLPALKPDPLTNSAYGFPTRGHKRRIKPVVLAVIHITGNPRNQGPDAAQNERDYANRASSDGPSAHVYIGRAGGGVAAIDWRNYAAWSNGDLEKPNPANKGVREIVGLHAHGYNANEACGIEIENVGYAKTAGQMTTEQIRRCAGLVARASIEWGLPINRSTVLAHADINTVDRQNCPALAPLREELLRKIIVRARARKKVILGRVA